MLSVILAIILANVGDTSPEWPVSEYFNEGPESRREAYFAMSGIIHDLNIARLASAGEWRTDTIL